MKRLPKWLRRGILRGALVLLVPVLVVGVVVGALEGVWCDFRWALSGELGKWREYWNAEIR